MHVLQAGGELNSSALRMNGAAGHKHTTGAVQSSLFATLRASASGPSFRKGNGIDDLGFDFCRQAAAPEEAKRGELLLYLQHPKAFIFGNCGLDFFAGSIQKVAPSVATRWIAFCRLRDPLCVPKT